MRSHDRSRLFLVVAFVGIAATVYCMNKSKGQAVEKPAQALSASTPGKLVVHEWGTFTSFSGSNGVQLDFRPLISEDLPNFVFDRRMQSGVPDFSKGHLRAQVRMETPVTYFYTDHERTVSARVDFPDGLLTEFYPPVVSMAPDFGREKSGENRIGKSNLDWGQIHLIPAISLVPNVQDETTKSWLTSLIQSRVVPNDPDPSNHYYHARETDSAFVHFRRAGKTTNPHLFQKDYLEKFLFYRGVGRFEQPLQVSVANDGRVIVTNSGPLPIRSLFRVTVSDGQIRYSELAGIDSGMTIEFPSNQKVVTIEDLMDRVVVALVREQLYPREATAMVKTWQDSWFAEEGTRLFYMLPRDVTDQVLPLTISPVPDETVRVLVGRIEVMPQSVEKELMEVVRVNAEKRATLQAASSAKGINTPVSPGIPNQLTKLGRFAEPALVRIRELARDNAVSAEAETLLQECRQAFEKGSKSLTATSEET